MVSLIPRPFPKPKTPPRKSGFRKWEAEADRLKKTTSLGAALHQLIERLGYTTRFQEQQAVEVWAEVVGETIAKVTEPVSVADGVLTIKVNNPTWRNELTYLKPDILTKLNRRLARKVVSDIVFK
jgi:predicted nucleic acid-binding Zn ribbon protein